MGGFEEVCDGENQAYGIICSDPDQLREYYCRWFGFDELNRTPEGSVYLTFKLLENG